VVTLDLHTKLESFDANGVRWVIRTDGSVGICTPDARTSVKRKDEHSVIALAADATMHAVDRAAFAAFVAVSDSVSAPAVFFGDRLVAFDRRLVSAALRLLPVDSQLSIGKFTVGPPASIEALAIRCGDFLALVFEIRPDSFNKLPIFEGFL